jgi:hypothetical protein
MPERFDEFTGPMVGHSATEARILREAMDSTIARSSDRARDQLGGYGNIAMPKPRAQPEGDSLETIVRREREYFTDGSDDLTDDALRELIREYAAAGRDECIIIIARTLTDGDPVRMVQGMILAMAVELARRAGR